MCDLNRASGFLIAANTGYIAVLVTLGAVVANSASLFAAAANVPLMLVLIGAMALVNLWLFTAIKELESCTGVCAGELAAVLSSLYYLQGTLLGFAGSLIALAAVAAIPFVGAGVAVGVIAVGAILVTTFSAVVEVAVGRAIDHFNTCRSAAGESTFFSLVSVLCYLAAVAVFVTNALAVTFGFNYLNAPPVPK